MAGIVSHYVITPKFKTFWEDPLTPPPRLPQIFHHACPKECESGEITICIMSANILRYIFSRNARRRVLNVGILQLHYHYCYINSTTPLLHDRILYHCYYCVWWNKVVHYYSFCQKSNTLLNGFVCSSAECRTLAARMMTSFSARCPWRQRLLHCFAVC